MSVTPLRKPEPTPTDPVAQAAAALALARAERGERFVEMLGDVLSLAEAICADTGDRPGLREGARKIVTALGVERLAMQRGRT